MKELDGFNIPDLAPTVDGSCGGDPAAAADAAKRGWWTCGGHTRSTGMSFIALTLAFLLTYWERYCRLPG